VIWNTWQEASIVRVSTDGHSNVVLSKNGQLLAISDAKQVRRFYECLAVSLLHQSDKLTGGKTIGGRTVITAKKGISTGPLQRNSELIFDRRLRKS